MPSNINLDLLLRFRPDPKKKKKGYKNDYLGIVYVYSGDFVLRFSIPESRVIAAKEKKIHRRQKMAKARKNRRRVSAAELFVEPYFLPFLSVSVGAVRSYDIALTRNIPYPSLVPNNVPGTLRNFGATTYAPPLSPGFVVNESNIFRNTTRPRALITGQRYVSEIFLTTRKRRRSTHIRTARRRLPANGSYYSFVFDKLERHRITLLFCRLCRESLRNFPLCARRAGEGGGVRRTIIYTRRISIYNNDTFSKSSYIFITIIIRIE